MIVRDTKAEQFVGVCDTLHVLKALRAGDTNEAIDELEGQMDRHLMGFGAMVQAVPQAERKPTDFRVISRIREYRAAYPRRTDSAEIDQFVAGILSLTNSETHKP
jgi:hypothetical protein